jgi:hypothetical protein
VLGVSAVIATFALSWALLWFWVRHTLAKDLSDHSGVERGTVQRIAVNYIVVLRSVGDFKARGPALLRDAVGWANVIAGGLSLGFYPIKCALGLDYYGQTWGTVATPVVLIVVCLANEVAVSATARRRAGAGSFLSGSVFITLYLFYPTVVQSALTGKRGCVA